MLQRPTMNDKSDSGTVLPLSPCGKRVMTQRLIKLYKIIKNMHLLREAGVSSEIYNMELE